jgi:hypothetical protein
MAITPNSAPYDGHDEGSNGSPVKDVFTGSGATFAPMDQGVSGGTTQKNPLGSSGKADGQS